MGKRVLTCIAVLISMVFSLRGQDTSRVAPGVDTLEVQRGGSAYLVDYFQNMPDLVLGAYGQIDYTQPISSGTRYNGKMDVHRLVPFMIYNFNNRLSFFTEIEIEHVDEVYVEQAFVNYRLNNWATFKSGLILVPMGIINEYHEPTTFNGVTRPNMDHDIVPTTWRELGAGFTGRFNSASLKYQLFVVNGFSSYNGTANLTGKEGFRGGRQKASKSMISSPNISAKVDYYGIRGLQLGLAGYFGRSQSTLYHGLDRSNDAAVKRADSSIVGLSMVGLDARYQTGGFQARGQYIFSSISNAGEYNAFTGQDLGSVMNGYYVEAGYDMLKLLGEKKQQLILFSRYSNYDTHASTPGNTPENDAYDRTYLTTGLSYKPGNRVVYKADYQFADDATGADLPGQLNFGIGVWFY